METRLNGYGEFGQPYEAVALPGCPLSSVDRMFNHMRLTEEDATLAGSIIDTVSREEPLQLLQSRMRQVDERETLEQSSRVAFFAVSIGQLLGLPGEDLGMLARGALCHDAGKSVPRILKYVRSGEQYEKDKPSHAMTTIKEHPRLGSKLVMTSNWPQYIKNAVAAITQGHHMFQKNPYGVAPKGYTLWAEIVSFSDKLDAFLSDRTWRPALLDIPNVRIAIDDEHVGPYKEILMMLCFDGVRFSAQDYLN
jgi:response regulator RpfG family c-di-GMP phosphodiesterase